MPQNSRTTKAAAILLTAVALALIAFLLLRDGESRPDVDPAAGSNAANAQERTDGSRVAELVQPLRANEVGDARAVATTARTYRDAIAAVDAESREPVELARGLLVRADGARRALDLDSAPLDGDLEPGGVLRLEAEHACPRYLDVAAIADAESFPVVVALAPAGTIEVVLDGFDPDPRAIERVELLVTGDGALPLADSRPRPEFDKRPGDDFATWCSELAALFELDESDGARAERLLRVGERRYFELVAGLDARFLADPSAVRALDGPFAFPLAIEGVPAGKALRLMFRRSHEQRTARPLVLVPAAVTRGVSDALDSTPTTSELTLERAGTTTVVARFVEPCGVRGSLPADAEVVKLDLSFVQWEDESAARRESRFRRGIGGLEVDPANGFEHLGLVPGSWFLEAAWRNHEGAVSVLRQSFELGIGEVRDLGELAIADEGRAAFVVRVVEPDDFDGDFDGLHAKANVSVDVGDELDRRISWTEDVEIGRPRVLRGTIGRWANVTVGEIEGYDLYTSAWSTSSRMVAVHFVAESTEPTVVEVTLTPISTGVVRVPVPEEFFVSGVEYSRVTLRADGSGGGQAITYAREEADGKPWATWRYSRSPGPCIEIVTARVPAGEEPARSFVMRRDVDYAQGAGQVHEFDVFAHEAASIRFVRAPGAPTGTIAWKLRPVGLEGWNAGHLGGTLSGESALAIELLADTDHVLLPSGRIVRTGPPGSETTFELAAD
ncbi:MAG: hypothetical protein R3F34_04075 [Planctomycetota bacterium]